LDYSLGKDSDVVGHDEVANYSSLEAARYNYGEAQLQMGWNEDKGTGDTLYIRRLPNAANVEAVEVFIWLGLPLDRVMELLQGEKVRLANEHARLDLAILGLDMSMVDRRTTLYAGEAPK
jgi:hypothetical protein